MILYYDEAGNTEYEHDPFPESPFAGDPLQAETAAPAPVVTEAPEIAAEEAPEVTEPAAPSYGVANTDYGSRDESLMTLSVVVVSVIVVLVVVIIIVMKRISKR